VLCAGIVNYLYESAHLGIEEKANVPVMKKKKCNANGVIIDKMTAVKMLDDTVNCPP